MSSNALKLGVNIDHVATLREARGTSYPDVIEAARLCEVTGAHGITVHLREDRRHIQDRDIYALRKSIKTRMNLEMANNPEIIDIALDVHPNEVCLVPERREELTTEGGLDVAGQAADLRKTVRALRKAGIVVSLFVDPDRPQIAASAEVGAPYIELHTGAFCNAHAIEQTGPHRSDCRTVRTERCATDDSPLGRGSRQELERLISGAVYAHELGLNVNAGHGLNLDNIENVLRIPYLDTLNIGHSIVSRAVFVGMEQAVREMLEKIAGYSGGEA